MLSVGAVLQTILIPLKKKANPTICVKYGAFSLLTHALRILLSILTKWLQAKAEADGCLGEDQFGLRRGRGTRDAIEAMAEGSLENNLEVCTCFVEYEKAFDGVYIYSTSTATT